MMECFQHSLSAISGRSFIERAMTRETLTDKLGELAAVVRADPRWAQDDLSVSILGMLLFGFGLAVGRSVMLLEVEDIEAAVLKCLVEHVGAAEKWSSGLVTEATAAAFNKAHHLGHHSLIGIGHSYFGVTDQKAVVDNIFLNVASFRKRVDGNA
jgi:hypothetical protein